MHLKFIRTLEIIKRRDYSKATYYKEVESGLMPTPIRAGGRQAGIFEHELDQIMSAYARGLSVNEIKELVQQIEKDRKSYGLNAA